MTNIEVSRASEEQQRIYARMCRISAEMFSVYAESCNFRYFFHPIQLCRLVKQHRALGAQHYAMYLEHCEALARLKELQRKQS
jgi:hypothetical protein